MIENLRHDPHSVFQSDVVAPALADARWYAVQTMPRHEKKVSLELTAKAIECFLPTVSSVRQWSDRKRIIVEPLFTGYVFARLVPASPDRITLLRSNGVVGLVGMRGVGVPIPENEIHSIQRIVESRAPYASHPFLTVGKRVRIRGGALDGLEGILQSVNGDESLVVSVELIQRSLSLTISGYRVEPVPESKTTLLQSAAQV
jgi:transcription termination/antitermination protein NusG